MVLKNVCCGRLLWSETVRQSSSHSRCATRSHQLVPSRRFITLHYDSSAVHTNRVLTNALDEAETAAVRAPKELFLAIDKIKFDKIKREMRALSWTEANKNSSEDEIANVNLFTTISHMHFKISKTRTYSV